MQWNAAGPVRGPCGRIWAHAWREGVPPLYRDRARPTPQSQSIARHNVHFSRWTTYVWVARWMCDTREGPGVAPRDRPHYFGPRFCAGARITFARVIHVAHIYVWPLTRSAAPLFAGGAIPMADAAQALPLAAPVAGGGGGEPF